MAEVYGQLVIEEYGELLALHRTIMEAKFATQPQQAELSSSPLVAAIAERVMDALKKWDAETHGPARAQAWDDWREATPERREWKIALTRVVTAQSGWESWSHDERKHCARLLLSPLRASDELLEEFVRQADEQTRS